MKQLFISSFFCYLTKTILLSLLFQKKEQQTQKTIVKPTAYTYTLKTKTLQPANRKSLLRGYCEKSKAAKATNTRLE
jgi:hypothetical protein